MSQSTSWLDLAREVQPKIWAVAVLAYGVGDLATTVLGLGTASTVAEAGPVAVHAFEAGGVAGLSALKIGFLAACFCLWYLLDTPGRVAVPLALAVTGVLVTGWNAVVILTA